MNEAHLVEENRSIGVEHALVAHFRHQLSFFVKCFNLLLLKWFAFSPSLQFCFFLFHLNYILIFFVKGAKEGPNFGLNLM